MRILGIETSCDETGVAVYDNKNGLIANKLYSQVKLHSNYGGVVPELASRNHVIKTIPLIKAALSQSSLCINDIDGVAYTAGPGLVGALMVGATIGRAIAYACKVPAIAINHIEGHLLTIMMEENPPSFPFLALLVSGGNTQLIAVKNIGKYFLLGKSIDDSVGEVLDKTAKLLGLGYPGGKILSYIARRGITGRYKFPRPMINRPGLDFSFSGLKTSVANTIRSISVDDEQTCADIARAFEDAVVDTLSIKCCRALDNTGFKRLVIAGGVSANITLRMRLTDIMRSIGKKVFFSRSDFCTDNGAMIAYAGMVRLQLTKKNNFYTDLAVMVRPRWSLEEDLSAVFYKN